MKNVATAIGIFICPKLINGPNGIQTQDTYIRILPSFMLCISVVLSDGPL